MGLREALARCFGRGRQGPSSTSKLVKKARRARRESEKILQASNRQLSGNSGLWSTKMMESYRDALNLGGFTVPEEAVCPLTRQIVLQELAEIAAKNEGLSIRQIIAHAMKDGVKDDYEFADRLRDMAADKPSIPMKLAEGVQLEANYDVRNMAHNVRISRGGKAMHVLMDELPIG